MDAGFTKNVNKYGLDGGSYMLTGNIGLFGEDIEICGKDADILYKILKYEYLNMRGSGKNNRENLPLYKQVDGIPVESREGQQALISELVSDIIETCDSVNEDVESLYEECTRIIDGWRNEVRTYKDMVRLYEIACVLIRPALDYISRFEDDDKMWIVLHDYLLIMYEFAFLQYSLICTHVNPKRTKSGIARNTGADDKCWYIHQNINPNIPNGKANWYKEFAMGMTMLIRFNIAQASSTYKFPERVHDYHRVMCSDYARCGYPSIKEFWKPSGFTEDAMNPPEEYSLDIDAVTIKEKDSEPDDCKKSRSNIFGEELSLEF